MTDLHAVTMETDAGPVDLRFGYRAVGDPAYSDVTSEGPWEQTEAEAEVYGAHIVGVGNWRSFTVEKRYFGEVKAHPYIEAQKDRAPRD